jgi:hypothetical protein
MAKALSIDLRRRVVDAIEHGLSCRQAAERFGVSASSAIRWPAEEARRRRGKEAGWRPQVGPHRSRSGLPPWQGRDAGHPARRASGEAAGARRQRRHRDALAFLRPAAHHVQKKTAHATEQQRCDVKAAREVWFEGQLDLDPTRLIFIDETSASTKMAHLYGRAPKGERCLAAAPHGHWKTTTFTAGLRIGGLAALWVLDGPMDGDAFRAYVEQVLVADLTPGDVVVMDQPASPQGAWRAARHRSGRRDADVSAGLLAGLQPHRDGILQVQGAPARRSRANYP